MKGNYKMTNEKSDPGIPKSEGPRYREQSLGEEIANSITHGIGALLSIAALVLSEHY